MKTAGIIGLTREELDCVRALLRILRHPDPVIAEVGRQAIAYLELLESKGERARLTQASASQ